MMFIELNNYESLGVESEFFSGAKTSDSGTTNFTQTTHRIKMSAYTM